MDKINSIESDCRIYTDRSTSGDQENGGAGIYVESMDGLVLMEEEAPAGKFCSSFSGECVALLRALEWIRGNQETFHRILIITDSKSLTEALRSNNWKDKDHWIKRIKSMLLTITAKVTLLWIPSHCDVEGNERADELAKGGSEKDQEDVHITAAIVKANFFYFFLSMHIFQTDKWTIYIT